MQKLQTILKLIASAKHLRLESRHQIDKLTKWYQSVHYWPQYRKANVRQHILETKEHVHSSDWTCADTGAVQIKELEFVGHGPGGSCVDDR